MTSKSSIDWMLVNDRKGTVPIGAVAFVRDDPTVVVSFYDERDANKDGIVSKGEWLAAVLFPISLSGVGSLEVISRARDQATLALAESNGNNSIRRAVNLKAMQGSHYQAVGMRMALDGVFTAYLSHGVSSVGGAVAEHLGAGKIKTFMIKKGTEKAAKAAFDAASRGR